MDNKMMEKALNWCANKTNKIREKSQFFKLSSGKKAAVIAAALFFTIYFMGAFKLLPFDTAYIYQRRWPLLINFFVIFLIFLYVYPMISRLEIGSFFPQRADFKVYIFYLLFSLCIMGLIYFLDYPAKSSVDVSNQYGQALSGEYNNWHPVVHTFIFYKVPMMIFGNDLNNVYMFN